MGIRSWFEKLFFRAANNHTRPLDEAAFNVSFDDSGITTDFPASEVPSIAWVDVSAIIIRTTSLGPWQPDFFWSFVSKKTMTALSFPQGATGEGRVLAELQRRYPAFDNQAFIMASSSTNDATFLVWSQAS